MYFGFGKVFVLIIWISIFFFIEKISVNLKCVNFVLIFFKELLSNIYLLGVYVLFLVFSSVFEYCDVKFKLLWLGGYCCMNV